MTDNYYKVVCKDINLVLLIKKLSLKEEQKAYLEIKKKISNLKKPITIESYQKWILGKFLQNYEDFYDQLPTDAEESSIVIRAVYEAVIEAYPPFDLVFVCTDINNSTFINDIREHLGDLFGDLAESDSSLATPPIKAINTLKDITALESFLKKNIIGQDEAVASLVNCMKLIASGLYKSASFFFIGPTGVGKTEIGKLLGKKYSGNFWKINCAEYASAHEYAKLIGSPPGYIGHSDTSLMAEKAEKSNRWVILFDEIEKAHHKFYDFLLSLLDDGNCTDNMGRVLDFSESIFIFTSNEGISHMNLGKRIGFDNSTRSVSSCKEDVKESVKKKFPAEFLNRIDNYVFFNQLSRETVKKISQLALKGIPIKRHKCLLDYVVDNGYSEEYGARNIKRFIKNNVATKVAQSLLERRLPKKAGDLYTPKVVDNELFITGLEVLSKDQSAD